MAVASSEDKSDHLGHRPDHLYWDWSRESPVEIVLVIFILVLFFMIPRSGCGIDNQEGTYPTRSVSTTGQQTNTQGP